MHNDAFAGSPEVRFVQEFALCKQLEQSNEHIGSKKNNVRITVHLLVGWEWNEIQNGWDGSHLSNMFQM